MEENRVRLTFNNSDQRIDIWLTPDELKRMLTNANAWEAKAWQSDVDKLNRDIQHLRGFIMLFTAVFFVAGLFLVGILAGIIRQIGG